MLFEKGCIMSFQEINGLSMKMISKCFCKGFAVIMALMLLLGCAAKIPHMIVPEYNKRGTRLIAVMPVINKSSDEKAAAMLREKVLEALFQKGYPKIPLQVIDDKIPANGNPDLNKVRDLLNVDAVMLITLEECTRSVTLLFAKTYVAASFVLKNVKTGEVLWEVRHRAGERNFDVTRKGAELKSVQVYEPIMQEVVDRSMDTLPDGPDL
jgi:hypothetical protein